MTNLVQVAEDLESMPKEMLIQNSQNPNSTYPQFLVISEIQRRTQNEKAYAAAQPQPKTTVAEEVVNEFAQPSGLQGMNSNEMMSQNPTPMQMAASGGITGYANTGSTNYLDTAKDYAQDYFTNDDGSIDWSNTALAASMVVPGGLAAKGIYGLGRYGLGALAKLKNPIGKFLQKGFTRPKTNPSVVSKKGKQFDPKSTQGQAILHGTNPPKITQIADKSGARLFSPLRTALTTSVATGIPSALMSMSEMGQDQISEQPGTNGPKVVPITNNGIAKRIDNLEGGGNSSSGLGGAIMNYMNEVDGLDLAKLGGIIMGSKDLSELGKGIAGIAESIQDRRQKEKLSDIQGRLYESQISKYDAEVENMEPAQIVKTLEAINEAIELANESNTGEDINTLLLQRSALLKKYNKVTGLKVETQAEKDEKRKNELLNLKPKEKV